MTLNENEKKLLEAVEFVRENYPMGSQTNWVEVKKHLQSVRSTEALRSHYRRLTTNMKEQIKERHDMKMGRNTLEKKLLPAIKRKCSIDYLIDRFNTDEDSILKAVAKLQLQGYKGVRIFDEEGVTYVHNKVTLGELRSEKKDINVVHKTYEPFQIAVVSDTHIGSIYSDLDALNEFYDIVEGRGITEVYHAGDISDGYYNNRPTSIMEQDAVGFTNQLKKIVNEYPKRENVTTYFITGNHDQTHQRNAFADIGEAISMTRDDMVYLGHNFARVHLTEYITLGLVHPTGGVSRNFNLHIRNMIDRNPGRRADILMYGHYHKLAMLKHMGIWGYITPSFQRQTTFMQDNNLESVVGGVIFTIIPGIDGKLDRIITEVIEF